MALERLDAQMDLKTDKQLSLRERNRLRTRSDILDAAAEMLGEGGYAGLALEEVSQRAGLSRGTVYAHFPGGRDDVVREVYLRVADAVHARGLKSSRGSKRFSRPYISFGPGLCGNDQ